MVIVSNTQAAHTQIKQTMYMLNEIGWTTYMSHVYQLYKIVVSAL